MKLDPSGVIGPQRHEQLVRIYRDGLLDKVMPFWLLHSIDREHGGIMAAVDHDGSVLDTDKSVWQQGRFAWMLGELYNEEQLKDHPSRQLWLETATQTLQFMSQHCFDVEDGRLWFHVTRDGQPIRKRRYSFGESFAAIAFGEIAQATGSEEYFEQAHQCFERFVNQHLYPTGFSPKFTETRPMKSIGQPMITIVTAQQLRESIGLESADEWIDRSIDFIRSDFLKPDIQCVMETVGQEGERMDHFDGRTLNPGHAIEAAWFIMEEARIRQDTQLLDMGTQMLDWMWQRGWDPEHGGLLYFVDVDGKPVQEYWHDMKFWWPHNEAMIATLLAFQLTADPKYLDWHAQVHDWAYAHFSHANGEWYGYLNRYGKPTSSMIGNLWKGPFHLPRMLLVCWRILMRMHHGEAIGEDTV